MTHFRVRKDRRRRKEIGEKMRSPCCPGG